MQKRIFGSVDGQDVYEITLSNSSISCSVLSYGCVLRSLIVRDRSGSEIDVVLGYDDLEQYRTLSGRLGAVIGRYANRIGDARFDLNGMTYQLTPNRGQDHIHGGASGFDKKIWNIDSYSDDEVTLSLDSPDGDEGYPGNMHVTVTYSLIGSTLRIGYTASSDADTVCSLTNHSYFNLGGSGDIGDHTVSICAGRYTPLNERSVPTGEIADVCGRLDLRIPRPMADAIMDGYDDNFLLDRGSNCASCYCERSGIRMDISSDMPAMQFYTGNGLKDGIIGKGGIALGRCRGLCFETQNCPDAPNHHGFPSSVLKAGETFRTYTEYRFSIEQFIR